MCSYFHDWGVSEQKTSIPSLKICITIAPTPTSDILLTSTPVAVALNNFIAEMHSQ